MMQPPYDRRALRYARCSRMIRTNSLFVRSCTPMVPSHTLHFTGIISRTNHASWKIAIMEICIAWIRGSNQARSIKLISVNHHAQYRRKPSLFGESNLSSTFRAQSVFGGEHRAGITFFEYSGTNLSPNIPSHTQSAIVTYPSGDANRQPTHTCSKRPRTFRYRAHQTYGNGSVHAERYEPDPQQAGGCEHDGRNGRGRSAFLDIDVVAAGNDDSGECRRQCHRHDQHGNLVDVAAHAT